MKRKLWRYAALLTAFLLVFGGGSCMKKDDTPVTSITDALKIKAYVYDESGETWSFEQLRLNEPKQLAPTYIFQKDDDLNMVNFNLHFEYEDGICIVSAPERNVQLSVGRNGGIWKRGEDESTRVFDCTNNYELTLSRAGYMAFTPVGSYNKNINMCGNKDYMVLYDNFEPYIGQEYYVDVTACDFDKVPVIRAQLKFTSLEDDSFNDGGSRYFSIELVSYEYSDIYKLMEGAG
ncbi:MAG: hypothetical protein IJW81_06655 [Clostridia bacterium]|nr:hypothetical protein [Clostridia bacterium]